MAYSICSLKVKLLNAYYVLGMEGILMYRKTRAYILTDSVFWLEMTDTNKQKKMVGMVRPLRGDVGAVKCKDGHCGGRTWRAECAKALGLSSLIITQPT